MLVATAKIPQSTVSPGAAIENDTDNHKIMQKYKLIPNICLKKAKKGWCPK